MRLRLIDARSGDEQTRAIRFPANHMNSETTGWLPHKQTRRARHRWLGLAASPKRQSDVTRC